MTGGKWSGAMVKKVQGPLLCKGRVRLVVGEEFVCVECNKYKEVC